MSKSHIEKLAEQIARDWVDKGKLIEGGWVGFKNAAIPSTTPPERIEQMRNVFFAGARHLFFSIVMLCDDADADATDQDIDRMMLIDEELRAFQASKMQTEGNA
ncbi:hypothetical protein [Bradyrhizobium lablabi]|uniref:hypothetical protein n=1 Tax=Bradyrhizobium lablabi TaxID=722472 RepID=UPI001BAB0160|nr:hypothetical protein [Bradyrhizobium lablabi]MBR0693605.1 hypothetical protein [Bradyrhizobium lablabi]